VIGGAKNTRGSGIDNSTFHDQVDIKHFLVTGGILEYEEDWE